jgi:predicted PurR-regulated permease PerM
LLQLFHIPSVEQRIFTFFGFSMDLDNNQLASNSSANREHRQKKQLSIGDSILIGIFVLLLLCVFKYASAILVPLTFAILLSLLFAPVVQLLAKLRIPRRIGAAIVVAGIVTVIAGGIMALAEPAQGWLDKSPQVFHEIEEKLQKIKQPLKQIQEAAEKAEVLTELDQNAMKMEVKPNSKKLIESFFSATPEVLAFFVLSIVLLYFMLYSGKTLVEYIIRAIFWLAHQRNTVDMGRLIQQEISRYLLTITIINICLGISVALALTLIGLPNPILWGTMVTLLNFAPYIGAICSAIIITIVSLVTFDSMFAILLAPAVFVIITSLEGQFITPQILGNRFSMNPLLVFLTIVFWGWLWGYVGALLAFPLMVSTKILCQSVDVLKPFADFLEDT